MQAVTKVMMFPYRIHSSQPEFFVIQHEFGNVVPTGHVGDTIKDESLEGAARREIEEELGVKAESIIDLDYVSTVELPTANKLSTEHAFLVRIPDQEVTFLEAKRPHLWVSLNDLADTLSFDQQKGAIPKIKPNLLVDK
jgi:ADP-ribose pyrophosphatase YjhB (NUDIX family)